MHAWINIVFPTPSFILKINSWTSEFFEKDAIVKMDNKDFVYRKCMGNRG